MSGIQEGRGRGFVAGEDLSGSRFVFVKLHTTQNQVVAATAATDNIIGIVTNSPKTGYEAAVTLLNGMGTMLITASTTISLGAKVTATTGGKAVTATQTAGGSQPTVVVAGIALEAATGDGHQIEIMLTRFNY
jgi:hypothetical protein